MQRQLWLLWELGGERGAGGAEGIEGADPGLRRLWLSSGRCPQGWIWDWAGLETKADLLAGVFVRQTKENRGESFVWAQFGALEAGSVIIGNAERPKFPRKKGPRSCPDPGAESTCLGQEQVCMYTVSLKPTWLCAGPETAPGRL